MKRMILLALVSFLIMGASSQDIKRHYGPNSYACPLTKMVQPEKITANHDTDILKKLLKGIDKTPWTVSKGGDSIKCFFGQNKVIRRIQLAIKGDVNKEFIIIKLTWISGDKTSNWPDETIYLNIKPDGMTYCFYLDVMAEIPGNIPAKEILLKFPDNISILKLSFSEKPTEFVSVRCPMPGLELQINKAYDEYMANPKDEQKLKALVGLLRDSMDDYDCLREYDFEPAVPAWWLCKDENAEKWFDFLATSESKEAKELLGSELFRKTLDGYFAEEYYDRSLEVEKQLQKDKQKNSTSNK